MRYIDIFNIVGMVLLVIISIIFILSATGILEFGVVEVETRNDFSTHSHIETSVLKEESYLTIVPVTMRVSGYAPLDPKAKEGVCYSGNPKITASGSKTTPYRTIAADKSIPFGTIVRIEGFDEVFVVEDRGGKIKGNRIDVCFSTQQEAVEFGVKKLAVVMLRKVE